MDQKEKMKELIKKKQGGGRSKQMETPKNDRKNGSLSNRTDRVR
ncbi:hypothetical protein [Enterococcus faecium]|nr:hypothetical protein [Enterococcus faecium]